MTSEKYSRTYRRKYLINLTAVILCLILCLCAFLIEYAISSTKAFNPGLITKFSDLEKTGRYNFYRKVTSKHIYDLSFKMGNHQLYGILFDGRIVVVETTPGDNAKVIKSKDGTYSMAGAIHTYNNEEFNNLKSGLEAKGFNEVQLKSRLSKQYLRFVSPYRNLYNRFPIEIIILIVLFLRPINYLRINRRVVLSTQVYSKGNTKEAYAKVEEELSSPSKMEIGIFTLTQNYIVANSKRIIFALPIKELVWIFKADKSRLPWSRKKLILIFSTGEQYKVIIYKKEEASVEELIKQISEISPTTFIGTSKEHYILYKKHRREFMKYWRRRIEEQEEKSL